MFEITERPIAVDQMIKAVEHEGNGAVVTFLGVVRAHSKGKAVRYLEYEAYAEMAVPKLSEIGQEIHQRWGLERVAIVHRVGHLEIGETAVAIAVGSPHRSEAFEACHYAIDRIKSFVPVWKKEVWEDGEVWVGREGG
ncbi:MAG: molybdenum cofactor biosynthesis protein MoaE [Chloroflexota bacterium]|nr:MAG: molybdenum cofactor biosynthesis protein MoaE [Chloroflexota bacterium]